MTDQARVAQILEAVAADFANEIALILKINAYDLLHGKPDFYLEFRRFDRNPLDSLTRGFLKYESRRRLAACTFARHASL